MYNVPVINYDTQASETLKDVLFSLQQLSKTIDLVYNRIEERVTLEKNRLASVNNRISVCQEKVNQIKGCNKAITVFSTSKFPTSAIPAQYPSLIENNMNAVEPFNPPDENTHYKLADSKLSTISNPNLYDELGVMLTRLIASHNNVQNNSDLQHRKQTKGRIAGVGTRPPDNIQSTTSMLVFNSSIDPYKNYQPSDNLARYGRSKEDINHDGDDDVSSTKILASAPITLMNGDSDSSNHFLPDIHALDLTFRPEMGQHNALSLPSDLPLGSVAENIRYGQTTQSSIAPSVQLQANYSLLQITEGGISNSQLQHQHSSSTQLVINPSNNNSKTVLTYSPNPTKRENIIMKSSNSIVVANNLPVTQTETIQRLLPPPPPPPSFPRMTQSLTELQLPQLEPTFDTSMQHTVPLVDTQSIISSNTNNAAVAVTITPSLSTSIDERNNTNNANNAQVTSNVRPSFLDAIKATGSSRLKPVAVGVDQRNAFDADNNNNNNNNIKNSANNANNNKPKKMSMMEEIQAKMKRRNSVLSGQEDKMQQRRDSAIVQAAAAVLLLSPSSSSSSSSQLVSMQVQQRPKQQNVSQQPLVPQQQKIIAATTRSPYPPKSNTATASSHSDIDGFLSLVSMENDETDYGDDNRSVFSDMSNNIFIPTTRTNPTSVNQSNSNNSNSSNIHNLTSQSMTRQHHQQQQQFTLTSIATSNTSASSARRGSLLDNENTVLNSLLVLAKDRGTTNNKKNSNTITKTYGEDNDSSDNGSDSNYQSDDDDDDDENWK